MWHARYVDGMVHRAIEELRRLGVKEKDIDVHHLPGSLELPLAARILFETEPKLDGIIAFGVVLKGATSHNDSVLEQVMQGFALTTDRFGKPIINEVIGVNDLKDAADRSGDDIRNKGVEAAFALSEYLNWKNSLSE
jgi:6,7-dimethyl-8-ribityllumazine synthase